MAALSAFSPLIAPFVPGAPSVAIEAAALQGAIVFCEKTLTLQRSLAAVTTVANQAGYTLTQAGEVVVKLLGAKVDGKPLGVIVDEDLDETTTPITGAASPSDVLLSGPMQITLSPTPSVAGQAVVVRAAMRPAQSATTVDDSLYERHAMAVAHYAIHWLTSQQGTAYANDKLSAGRLILFNDAVADEIRAVARKRARQNRRPAVHWA